MPSTRPSPCPSSAGPWALLAVFPAAVWLAEGHRPAVLFAIAGAAALTGGALWLLVALTRTVSEAPLRSPSDERWRVQATATNLPPDPPVAQASPTRRVLTAADVDDLATRRAIPTSKRGGSSMTSDQHSTKAPGGGVLRRVLAALPALTLLAVLTITASAEYQLARTVLDLHPQIAWALPAAIDSYVLAALHTRRDVPAAITVMAGALLASMGAHLAQVGRAGQPLPVAWTAPLATAIMTVLVIVAWRVHVLIGPEDRPTAVLPNTVTRYRYGPPVASRIRCGACSRCRTGAFRNRCTGGRTRCHSRGTRLRHRAPVRGHLFCPGETHRAGHASRRQSLSGPGRLRNAQRQRRRDPRSHWRRGAVHPRPDARTRHRARPSHPSTPHRPRQPEQYPEPHADHREHNRADPT